MKLVFALEAVTAFAGYAFAANPDGPNGAVWATALTFGLFINACLLLERWSHARRAGARPVSDLRPGDSARPRLVVDQHHAHRLDGVVRRRTQSNPWAVNHVKGWRTVGRHE